MLCCTWWAKPLTTSLALTDQVTNAIKLFPAVNGANISVLVERISNTQLGHTITQHRYKWLQNGLFNQQSGPCTTHMAI